MRGGSRDSLRSRGMTQRKFIVYAAVSADGYIARPDGDIDWLNRRPDPAHGYGYSKFVASCDTVIVGRKTYDFALSMGQKSFPGLDAYVFTHRPLDIDEVEFVSGDVAPLARKLRASSGKNIWLCGGAEIIAQFLDIGAVDEFSIHVIPTLIGEGIPLIAPRHRDVPLELIDTNAFDDGVVHLHYRTAFQKRN